MAFSFFGFANKLLSSVCDRGMPPLAQGNFIVFLYWLFFFWAGALVTFSQILLFSFILFIFSSFYLFFFFFLLSIFLCLLEVPFLKSTYVLFSMSFLLFPFFFFCLLPRARVCNFQLFICFPNIHLLTISTLALHTLWLNIRLGTQHHWVSKSYPLFFVSLWIYLFCRSHATGMIFDHLLKSLYFF